MRIDIAALSMIFSVSVKRFAGLSTLQLTWQGYDAAYADI